MKNKLTLLALLLASVLLVAGWTSQGQRTQYAYKTVEAGTMSEAQLNEIGLQGWELVAIGRDTATGTRQTFYFKRPKT